MFSRRNLVRGSGNNIVVSARDDQSIDLLRLRIESQEINNLLRTRLLLVQMKYMFY